MRYVVQVSRTVNLSELILWVDNLQIRMPEAWRPGKFDIWGHSHQIFHVFMVVGLTIHFSAFAKAFDYTHRSKQC